VANDFSRIIALTIAQFEGCVWVASLEKVICFETVSRTRNVAHDFNCE
jgi:hypothetical protein